MKILITRPQEDGKEIAARLAERGHQALLAPLLTPRFHDGPEPDLKGVQAILATSANGIRALRPRTARRDIPIFAVGPQTAKEARDAGFTNVRSADGDAKALADATAAWVPPGATLLHVCAEDAPGTLSERLNQAGFAARRCALYRIEPATNLPSETQAALRAGSLDAVMFFSPRSAGIFALLTEGLPTEGLTALSISRATAEALAPRDFAQIKIAGRPNQDAMLALTE